MIRWSKLVQKQFQAIHDYIAKEDPKAALRQISLIFKAIDQLKAFPVSGRIGDVSLTRELVVPRTPYVVYYRIVSDDVILLKSIRHAARQKPRNFTQ